MLFLRQKAVIVSGRENNAYKNINTIYTLHNSCGALKDED